LPRIAGEHQFDLLALEPGALDVDGNERLPELLAGSESAFWPRYSTRNWVPSSRFEQISVAPFCSFKNKSASACSVLGGLNDKDEIRFIVNGKPILAERRIDLQRPGRRLPIGWKLRTTHLCRPGV
jgi:hypothetical protein